MSQENLKRVGYFLRRKRESLAPETLGLAKPSRTRTPGLRREDVSAISGISTVWYSKIERGKADGISEAVLQALCDTLQMLPSERQYLKDLLGATEDPPKAPCLQCSPEGLRLLQVLAPLPAMMINDYSDIIQTNDSFNKMCGFDVNAYPDDERNYIYLTITDSRWQKFLGISDDDILTEEISRMAGVFRSMMAPRPTDDKMQRRLGQFFDASEVFQTAWEQNFISPPHEFEKEFHHAVLGPMSIKKQIWGSLSGETSGRLNVFHPVSQQDFERLKTV